MLVLSCWEINQKKNSTKYVVARLTTYWTAARVKVLLVNKLSLITHLE